jgi:DNA-binding NtrC family response regulator
MAEPVSLIVDDEPSIRAYLREILHSQGIRSVEAGTAIEALKTLHGLKGQVDLLITDIQMPGDMDGLDLAYSAVNSFPTLPVILISGYSDKSTGNFMFIRKPFVPAAILEAVNRVIMPRSRPASPGIS